MIRDFWDFLFSYFKRNVRMSFLYPFLFIPCCIKQHFGVCYDPVPEILSQPPRMARTPMSCFFVCAHWGYSLSPRHARWYCVVLMCLVFFFCLNLDRCLNLFFRLLVCQFVLVFFARRHAGTQTRRYEGTERPFLGLPQKRALAGIEALRRYETFEIFFFLF